MDANIPRPRKRKGHAVLEEAMGELNLVPYLDVMVNLIMFLMLTTTTASSFGLLSFNVPSFSKGIGGGVEPTEKPLELTVFVTKEGFKVVSNKGAPLDPIPRGASKEDDGYDFKKLRALMTEIGKLFPKTKNATVFAAPSTPYWIVVKTMDTLREAEPGACKIRRGPPTTAREKALPFDPAGRPACEISDDGRFMQCRVKEQEIVTYNDCLFPELILSDKVK